MASVFYPFLFLSLYSLFVASVHISAPDHWLTISFISRKKRWKQNREAAFSSMVGALHALFSLTIAVFIVYIGIFTILDFRVLFDVIAGYFLLIGGSAYSLYFIIKTYKNPFRKEEIEELESRADASSFALGLSLSPDLAAVSVILLAVPLGYLAVGIASLIFTVTSMILLPILVMLSSKGIGRALSRIRPEVNDIVIGLVLALTGMSLIIFQ
ncbi:MAG: hypothetical protein AAE977_00675 [Thermoplasmataceae archaeon]|jgi:hypothetical protein